MSLFGLLKRHTVTPPEVIQAACNVYGISPEHTTPITAKQLSALSQHIWVVQVNEHDSAVVAYSPHDKGATVAAPWYN
jgi:hypothetical protein